MRTVYSTSPDNMWQIELMKQGLDNAGIPAIISGEYTSSMRLNYLLGNSSLSLIIMNDSDYSPATSIIKRHIENEKTEVFSEEKYTRSKSRRSILVIGKTVIGIGLLATALMYIGIIILHIINS